MFRHATTGDSGPPNIFVLHDCAPCSAVSGRVLPAYCCRRCAGMAGLERRSASESMAELRVKFLPTYIVSLAVGQTPCVCLCDVILFYSTDVFIGFDVQLNFVVTNPHYDCTQGASSYTSKGRNTKILPRRILCYIEQPGMLYSRQHCSCFVLHCFRLIGSSGQQCR